MTPRERAERLIDLTGEIKQADALILECERDLAEKARQIEMAHAALAKQEDRRRELYAEALRLGDEAQADFHALVPAPPEPPPLALEDGPAPEMIVVDDLSAHGDPLAPECPAIVPERAVGLVCESLTFQAMAELHSANGIGRAFEEATKP